MKERPIPCKAHEVRAILDERKTQTRRVVKTYGTSSVSRVLGPYSSGEFDFIFPNDTGDPRGDGYGHLVRCPYGQPGDRLWVQETHRFDGLDPKIAILEKRADALSYRSDMEGDRCCDDCPWRPSIFMPRWASRITLEIESVRVESLTEIRERDARAEGIERIPRPEFGDYHWRNYGPPALINIGTHAEREVHYSDPIGSYKSLWNSINGPGSWDSNPWVWVIEFNHL